MKTTRPTHPKFSAVTCGRRLCFEHNLIGSLRSSHPFQEVFPSPLASVSSDLSFLQSPRSPSDRHQRSPPSRFCLSFLQVVLSVLPSSLPHRESGPHGPFRASLQCLLVSSHFCCAAALAVEPEAENCQHCWKPRVAGGRGWRGPRPVDWVVFRTRASLSGCPFPDKDPQALVPHRSRPRLQVCIPRP